MIIFPAIDLKNGQCVRLSKGDFDTVEVFSSNPVVVAKRFEDEGAKWLHVIDLDGAETGETLNTNVIKDIIANTSLNIQVGGGIRSEEKIIELLRIGITRVILGSYAVNNIEALPTLIAKYPNQIVVSVDSIHGFVTSAGWQKVSSRKTIDFCIELEKLGVKTIVYTDISKDGMMEGPSFQDYLDIMKFTNLDVIASGGVSSYSDVKQLASYKMYGAIIGKAIYLNKITVKEVIACLQEE